VAAPTTSSSRGCIEGGAQHVVLPQRLLCCRSSSGRLLRRLVLVLCLVVGLVRRPHVKGARDAVVTAAGVQQGLGLALQQHLLLLVGHPSKAAHMGQTLGASMEVGVETLVALGLYIKPARAVTLTAATTTAAGAIVKGITVHAIAEGHSWRGGAPAGAEGVAIAAAAGVGVTSSAHGLWVRLQLRPLVQAAAAAGGLHGVPLLLQLTLNDL
jgi:hypothetical protein